MHVLVVSLPTAWVPFRLWLWPQALSPVPRAQDATLVCIRMNVGYRPMRYSK